MSWHEKRIIVRNCINSKELYAVRKAFWFLWSKFNKLHFLCFILVLFFISRLNKIIWNKGGEGGKRIESIIAWVTEVAEHIYCNPYWSWLINGDGRQVIVNSTFCDHYLFIAMHVTVKNTSSLHLFLCSYIQCLYLSFQLYSNVTSFSC